MPVIPTPFIGRDGELAQIKDLLMEPECRLLTLVGAGGIGKTRLALELAHRLRDWLEDGVLFVPLTPITEASALPAAISQSLNLSFASEEQLFNVLQQQQMLVILDNCEQLGDDVAWFGRLARECPSNQIIGYLP